ncbi:MAG: LysR family transcriptional regulator [Acutalibacteraceae bacterium]|nr:LysR family transcriptional regulator [Acutalibacteraceae bacterium]
MNLLHMKHALEVAKAGSLSKASEVLLIAAPNISRSIKELEADLGITIFDRTQNGMKLTPEGEEFLEFAKSILGQIDQVENYYKKGHPKKQTFSISVPRASYICEAFAEFSKSLSKDAAEIFYKETNSQRTINNMLNHDYKLGIVRYAENYDMYFKTMLEEKGFTYELITEFTYKIIMSKNSPLAKLDTISSDDLVDYIEIAHADPYVPSMPISKVVKEELSDDIDRRIFVFERTSQFELLSRNLETFMWVSPIPKSLLERYDLVQKECSENRKIYKDLLIYKNGYKLSKLDCQFITELCESKRKYL